MNDHITQGNDRLWDKYYELINKRIEEKNIMKETLTHPQTVAESLANNMCLASCYLYIAGKKTNLEITDATIMAGIINAWRDGHLNNECYVADPEALIKYWTGKSCTVTKIEDTQAIAKILNSDEMVAAFYSVDTLNGHFVVMQHNKIIFNSLTKSRNVDKGTIVSLRRVQW